MTALKTTDKEQEATLQGKAAQLAAGNSVSNSSAEGERFTMETRFGTLEFGPENSIHMPIGPLGFTDFHRFGLVNLSNPSLDQFKLLQSLDNPDLGFIVTPLNTESGPISAEDLEDGALSVGIPVEDATFLLVVTVRSSDKGPSITVNLRAPVVLNVNLLTARQVVLANSNYPIQQPL